MSVLARQGIKYTIIGYAGFLLGALATYFLFPRNFAFYGELNYILSSAEIFVPLVVFGVSYANVKYFSQTKRDEKHQNIFLLSAGFILLNFLLFCGLFFGYKLIFADGSAAPWWQLRWYILALVFLLSLNHLASRYASLFKRIAVPNIFDNLFPKLANIFAFLLFLFGISKTLSLSVFVFVIFISTVGYWLYLNRLENIKFDFSLSYIRETKLARPFFTYAFYGFLGNIGNFIAIKIDKLMIGNYISMQELGIYSTLLAMVSLISVPQLGLFSISAPAISEYLESENFEGLDKFHKSTSLKLFFLGSLLFSALLAAFPFLTFYIKNGVYLRESAPVVWVLGTAILIDLATGFNGNIISMSRYFRVNIVMMGLLAGLTIGLNFLFLSKTNLGILGVACATAIALVVYNVTKLVFNWWKFRVNPVSSEMILLSILTTLSLTVSLALPNSHIPWVNVFYKPAVTVVLILVGNQLLKLIPLENYFSRNFLSSLFNFRKP